jgi:UDP-N-acetyl-D-mannosaminuronate dehydrogenase
MELDNVRLGYVGLPLAVEFGKVLPTVGFDINAKRIGELTVAAYFRYILLTVAGKGTGDRVKG